MANPNYVEPGLGPTSIQEALTYSKRSPATTATATPVTQLMPLRHDRPNTRANGMGKGTVFVADNDIPELFSNERCELPLFNIGMIVVPRPIANDPGAGKFVLQLAYSGAIPALAGAEVLGILCDATKGIKLVATGGIGTVLWAENGTVLVQL